MPGDIAFRTRGGPTQGWGNIFRLLNIADQARMRGLTVRAFAVEGPDVVADFVRGRGYEVIALPDDVGLDAEEKALEAVRGVSVMVAEMLDIHWRRQSLLKRVARRLIVLDDLLDHRYCADVVICAQDLPATANIGLSAPDTRFLVGPKYFPFHAAFQSAAGQTRTYTNDIERVLVAFGGGRYDLAYLKCAHAFAGRRGLTCSFILGPAGSDDLAHEIRALLPNASIVFGTDDMRGAFEVADVAVISAGYLKLEAAITGTPAIQIATQWHQIPLGETMRDRCGMPYLGYMAYVEPRDIATALDRLETRATREALGHSISALTDGQGVSRLLDEIVALANPT